MEMSLSVSVIILVALAFGFLNGMNDASKSIATVIGSQVLGPHAAVVWASVFNFAALFLVGTAIAEVIGHGIVKVGEVNSILVMAALFPALMWLWICTYLGLPVSASHSLIGGMIGAAVAKGGLGAVIWWPGIGVVVLFIIIAPVLGALVSGLFTLISQWMGRRGSVDQMNPVFRVLQLFSSAVYSIGHGANDAQKVAGIITLLLLANGSIGQTAAIPWWVLFVSYLALALGTLAAGWRVVRTLGVQMTKLEPMSGFCAEFAGALILALTSLFGIPISTTHAVTGAIMGVGATRRISAVRWWVARKVVVAWLLTIPVCALGAGVLFEIIALFH
jgi:inorganic phosphate transporter, PiT family